MTNGKSFVEARNGMIEREAKPRERGINYVRAPKILGQYFADFLTCYGALTDIIKLGTNQLTFIPEDEKKGDSARPRSRRTHRRGQSDHGSGAERGIAGGPGSHRLRCRAGR